MKQVSILIKCPDSHVNGIKDILLEIQEIEILGIDVKEIEGLN